MGWNAALYHTLCYGTENWVQRFSRYSRRIACLNPPLDIDKNYTALDPASVAGHIRPDQFQPRRAAIGSLAACQFQEPPEFEQAANPAIQIDLPVLLPWLRGANSRLVNYSTK